MTTLRHAGIHWPENSGGEHPNAETILGMPGILNGCTLICSPSARYWYRQAREASPLVIWRAIPRQGKLPAQLDWIGKRIAAECLNLWEEQPHGGIEHFTPLNELQFEKESGEPFRSYAETASKLSNVRIALRQRFQDLGQTVRLMFPAWVPMDDMARLSEWEDEARQWDTIGLHCYGSAETMLDRYESYRRAFPRHPLFVGEWNSNHEAHDEHESLAMWATVSDYDPAFLGATYYIWETNNAGEHDLSIWGNPERLALFTAPPSVDEPIPPVEPIPEEIPVPELDPFEFWPAEQIAAAAQCPVENVRTTMTHLAPQLALCGIWRRKILLGIIGTMAHETGSSFLPVREASFLGEAPDGNPDGLSPAERYRRELTYYPHYGRGDVQLTHEANYARYTVKLAELWGAGAPNLVANPDDTLDQDVAAAMIALWFRDERALPTPSWPAGYSLQNACDLDDDDWIRVLVYGGHDPVGQARIARVRTMLTGIATPAVLAYNPATPPERQIQNWVCAIRAATWTLKSLGVPVDAGQMQDEMMPGTVTAALGLLDGRGYGLASAIGRHLPTGTRIEVVEHPSWDAVWSRAGRGPICLGNGNPELYHWINVARQRGDGALDAPNPAPNHPAGRPLGDVLDRSEFERWGGSWNMVFVEVVPVVPDVPEPRPVGTPNLPTLVGVAYHDDGVVIPALTGAIAGKDWSQVAATVEFLRENNPDKVA